VLNKKPTRTSKTSVNLDNVPDMKFPLISVSISSILLKTPKVTYMKVYLEEESKISLNFHSVIILTHSSKHWFH